MSAPRSAQISTVKPVNRLKAHTCVLNAKKDTSSDKMDIVPCALISKTATASSRPRLSHVPVNLANTGTELAAVVTAQTTALTALLLDQTIVALVTSDTSSLRIPTPVSTSVLLDSSRPVPLKSATAVTP